jgi:Mg2+-importing ATPase
VSTIGVAVLALAIPYLPHASAFGFVSLPAPLLGCLIITVLYVAATEFQKHLFYARALRRANLGCAFDVLGI